MKPNILITGTPGVGKSRLCHEIAAKCDYNFLEVSAIAKKEGFVGDYDEQFECPELDEDALLDHLEPIMAAGGNIVEYHSCEMFPQRWFQAVYVVRCNNTLLFDRLTERGYNQKKLQSNVECEIFMEILNEATDSYDPEIVHQLRGETETDLEQSVEVVSKFIKNYNKS